MNTLGNDLEDDLDTSWIDDLDKLNNIHHSYFREPMKTIDFFILLVDSNDSIVKIKKEKHKFSTIDKNCTFTNSFIIEFIERIKNTYSKGKIRYKLNDVLLYNIDLEPEHIQHYVSNENLLELGTKKLQSLSIIQDFVIPPSIFIFHKINALFFVFKQVEEVVVMEDDVKLNLAPPPIMIQIPIKSILKYKSGGNYEGKSNGLAKTTKKVRIYDTKVDVKHKANTRKNISDIIT
jgi:hypothetical protein